MKQTKKYGLLFILIILVFMVSEAVASMTHMNYKLEYLNNKLSVNVEKVALGPILEEIQEKTGIIFQLDKEQSDKIISVGFQALPLEKAIQRILNNLNHAVIFATDYNIQKVVIVGKGKMSLAPPIHEHNISSSSTAMIIESPVQEGMKITYDGEPMNITNDVAETEIAHDGDEMKIAHPSDKMVIEPSSGEGMKITYTSNGNSP